jgi:hypothetical protein
MSKAPKKETKAGRPVEETPTKINVGFKEVFKVVKKNREQNLSKKKKP